MDIEGCDDLLQEMLIKLPVKTLLRFKFVSERWLKTITGVEFAARHHRHNLVAKKPSSVALVLRSFCGDSYSMENFITSIRPVGSLPPQLENIYLPQLEISESIMYRSNRLTPHMFSVGLGLYCIFKFPYREVALWNPSTREIKVLPSAPFTYDEELNFYILGFGHAEVKDDRLSYKVGMLSAPADWPNQVTLYLYSSVNDSWKLLTSNIGYESNHRCSGVNLNGNFHLLSDPIKAHPYIIVFDYSREAFSTMEMPDLSNDHPIFDYKILHSRLSLCDGTHLCLFLCWQKLGEAHHSFSEKLENLKNGRVSYCFDVWVMREYGIKESWRKEFTLGPFKKIFNVLSYWKRTRGVLLRDCNYDESGTRLHLCKCASSELVDLSLGSRHKESMFAFEHVESLVSIKGTPDHRRV